MPDPVPPILARVDWQPYYVAWCLIVHGREPDQVKFNGAEYVIWMRGQWVDLGKRLGFPPGRTGEHVSDMLEHLAALAQEAANA